VADLPLVQAGFGSPQRQNRWKIAFRLILVVPIALWLILYGVGAVVVVVLGWFAALVTGRLPKGFATFLTGYIVLSTRVASYLWLMHDAYPPFAVDANYVVNLDIPLTRVRRLAVLFRLILIVPAFIVSALVTTGLSLCEVIIWLIVLIKGSMPLPLFEAIAAVLRFQARVFAYFWMLTAKYPGELFGDVVAPDSAIVTTTSTPEVVEAHDETVSTDQVAPVEQFLAEDVTNEGSGSADGEPMSAHSPALSYPGAPTGQPVAMAVVADGSGPLGAPRTARMVLSRGAKWILVMFLVVGGIYEVAYNVEINSKIFASRSAAASLNDANDQLAQQINAALAARKTCTSDRTTCVKEYFARVDNAFGNFDSAISGISFPSSTNGDASTLKADTLKLLALLNRLSNGSGNVSQDQLNSLQSLLSALGSDYRQVVNDLNAVP